MLRFAATALAACLLCTCGGPSVPIPPPEPELVLFEADLETGTARFSYPPNADYSLAVVYVFNRDVGEGIITTAEIDGSVGPTEPFPAREGDEVVITFERDTSLGSVCLIFADGPGSSARECNP